MRKFVKTEKNGTLYWDKILFESVYPILFTCKNDKNEIFVVICCQNNATGINPNGIAIFNIGTICLRSIEKIFFFINGNITARMIAA